MADQCRNCDCSDKSQCAKVNQYGINMIETETNYVEAMGMEVAENDGCKCGSSCSCTNCTCGCH